MRYWGFTTPRPDGAQIMAAFNTSPDGPGITCSGCHYPIPPDAYHECWRLVEDSKPVIETRTVRYVEWPQ